jgi:hypothetical protein
MFARSNFFQIAITTHNHPYYLYFTISSPNKCTYTSDKCIGVLGTQETSWILIAGLLERYTFDLLLPEFDKPWVIHLRETCCCSTNLCTWRPNIVYKNRSIHRHQWSWSIVCALPNLYVIILIYLLLKSVILTKLFDCSITNDYVRVNNVLFALHMNFVLYYHRHGR